MPDRTYRDVDVDLDDLADAVVDWFEHDGFEVQDFQEGPAIFIQARKQNLLSTVTATTQALNVRLLPLASGFRVQIGAGEWLDKGIGAAVALGLKLISLPLALGTAAATGFGIYQQLKLPEQLLDFIETYVSRHGVWHDERESERRGRRGRPLPVDDDIESELEAMRRSRPASTGASAGPAPGGGGFCPQCGAAVQGGDNYCPSCGAKLGPRQPEARPSDDGE